MRTIGKRYGGFWIVAAVTLLPASGSPGELAPCADERLGPDSECGHFTVLEDRASATGRAIELELFSGFRGPIVAPREFLWLGAISFPALFLLYGIAVSSLYCRWSRAA